MMSESTAVILSPLCAVLEQWECLHSDRQSAAPDDRDTRPMRKDLTHDCQSVNDIARVILKIIESKMATSLWIHSNVLCLPLSEVYLATYDDGDASR
jgi:hypothetical protein